MDMCQRVAAMARSGLSVAGCSNKPDAKRAGGMLLGKFMTDVFSKRKRSALMSRIRGRGNKATELEFVRLLRAHKVTGWRRHVSVTLPKPKGEAVSSKHPRVRPDVIFQ